MRVGKFNVNLFASPLLPPCLENNDGAGSQIQNSIRNGLKPDCFQALLFRIGIQIGVRRGHAGRTDFQRHRQMQGIT